MKNPNTEIGLNPLFQAAVEVQHVFEIQKWPFCFIGGLAVLRWGDIRMTNDIDLCLQCGFGQESKYIGPLLDLFDSRITHPKEFALENRVLLMSASNKVPLDISLSGLAFEEQMITRASLFPFDSNSNLKTCSAEDLIILKAFANRTRDWMDIEGILHKQAKILNTEHIITNLTTFCEVNDSFEIIRKIKQLFQP